MVSSETATTTLRYDMVDRATNHALSTCHLKSEQFSSSPDNSISCDWQAAE